MEAPDFSRALLGRCDQAAVSSVRDIPLAKLRCDRFLNVRHRLPAKTAMTRDFRVDHLFRL
jgi:hypothetical protein